MFSGIMEMVANGVMVGVIVIYAVSLELRLALVMLLTVPLYVFGQRYSGRRVRLSTEALVRDWTDLGSFQAEKIAGMRLIKETGSEQFMSQEYRGLTGRAADTYRRQTLEGHVGTMLSNGVTFLGPMLILLVGSLLALTGSLTVGTLVAFFYFSGRLFGPIGAIVALNLSLKRAKVGMDDIFDFLAIEPSVIDAREPKVLPDAPLGM